MQFFFQDSSSSDDSNKCQNLILILTVKGLMDKKERQQWGSKIGRLCIPQSRALGYEMLMKDYLTNIAPTLLNSFVDVLECGAIFLCALSKLGRPTPLLSLVEGMLPVSLDLMRIKIDCQQCGWSHKVFQRITPPSIFSSLEKILRSSV
jgi:hypothetical protein